MGAGSVSGILSFATPVIVTYTGDVANPTQINNSGTDYYSNYSSVYTNSVVSNIPGVVDVIALQESPAFTNTITFSRTLLNPVLDLVSLGGGGNISYNFDQAFTILSQGRGYFGGCSTCLSADSTNTILSGTEGYGVVEFTGNVSSITWTTTGNEYWNGFTVGALDIAPSTTPEPGTWMFLLSSAPIAFLARRKLQA